MKLTWEAFGRAQEFLAIRGRPLEQALFRYFFKSGSAEEVLAVLAEHQAASGGFDDMGEGGHEGPTPIGSTIAFQYMDELGVGADASLVQKGIQYFLATYDHRHDVWPPRLNLPDPIESRLPDKWGNPSAEIVAYLWKYRELVPSDFLAHVTDIALENLRQLSVPIYEFADLCFLRLANFIDPRYREEIVDKVAAGIRENLQLNHDKWLTNYFVKPYWYAMTPDAPLHAQLQDEIEACLDYEIETQEAEGNFRLTWKVSDRARKTWKSIWTLEVLRVLQSYGRIEEE